MQSGGAKLPRPQTTALLVGILGAAESLTEAAGSNRLTRAETIAALARIMTTVLGPDQPRPVDE